MSSPWSRITGKGMLALSAAVLSAAPIGCASTAEPRRSHPADIAVYREGVFSAPLYKIAKENVERIGCATSIYESNSLEKLKPDFSGRRRCPTGRKEFRPDLAASLPPRDPKATAYLIYEDVPNRYFWILEADGRFAYVAVNRESGETLIIHENGIGAD